MCKSKNIFCVIVLSFCIAYSALAQTDSSQTLSLSEAQALMQNEHLQVKEAKLRIEADKFAQKTAFNLGDTEFQWQQGQINSALWDNFWQINQDFGSLPEQAAQRKVFQSQEVLSRVQLDNQIRELNRELALRYYAWQETYHKIALLQTYAERYESQKELADLRQDVGETNYFTKLRAEDQHANFILQQEILQDELHLRRLQFNELLYQTRDVYVPQVEPAERLELRQTKAVEASLQAQVGEQNIKLAETQVKLERKRFFPKLSAGYFYQQLDNVGGFQGLQLTVAAPLWYKAQKAQTEVARLQRVIAQNQYEQQVFTLGQQLKQLNHILWQYDKRLKFFEEGALQRAEAINEKNELLYQNGETGYFEYVSELSNLLQVQLDYLEILYQYNRTVIEINYLLQ